jgi:Ca2+-binding EF-hand superfamily protein
MFTMLRLETMDNWEDILYLTVFGCSNYPAYDYTAENPNMNCKESESYGFGWVGASIICSIVIFGAYVLPTVLIGVVSIKFDEATRYADTARHLKKHTKPLIEQAQQHLPDFFSKARILACRSLFDQMDTDSSLTLEYVALAPFYHYSFAKLFNVEITPDQCESIFQIMDTDRNANVSFDEFLVFVSTLKKLEKRCADNQEYKEFNFGYESFQGVKNDNEHSVWNRAMTRANHESVKLAWDNLFAALNGGNGTSMEEKVYILYNAFDSDNSGGMDEEELTTGLKECGCHMTATQVHAFIMAVDENGDGQLSFEEFFQLIKNEEAKRETEKREREQLEV